MKQRTFKPTFWLGLAITAIVLGVPTTAQAKINVVPNPGFEEPGCGTTPTGASAVICGWRGWQQNDVIFRDTSNPHSGDADMMLLRDCGHTGCQGGSVSVSAITDRASCASIGPGTHPASIWYWLPWDETNVTIGLSAEFFQAADCTGTFSYAGVPDLAIGVEAWYQLSGDLVAPVGTKSALFSVGLSMDCEDTCGISGAFDDFDVEGQLTAERSPCPRCPGSTKVGASLDRRATLSIP